MLRERDCKPAPHTFVHGVHALNGVTTQCDGQSCGLHSRVSAYAGHAFPPYWGSVWKAWRICEPLPQDFEQLCHGSHSATWQLIAQSCSLHARVSSRYGHWYPPWRASEATLRERDCEPAPHDFEHVVQALNAVTTQ